MASGAVVIDVGSGFTKVGYSGEDTPQSTFATRVATVDRGGMRDDSTAMYYVGNDLASQLPDSTLKGVDVVKPVVDGRIVKAKTMVEERALEKVFEAAFSRELGIDDLAKAGLPVLLADMPTSDRRTKETLTQMMFETFNAPGFHLTSSAVLSLIASGRTRGCVVECGADVTHIVPVVEGFALAHATRRIAVGGSDIDDHIRDHLAKVGTRFTSWQDHLVRSVKEELCCVAGDYEATMREVDGQSPVEHELPDGQTIAISQTLRRAAPEIIFSGSAMTDGVGAQSGLGQLIADSIAICDNDLKHDLYEHIVVAGGTSMLPGFAARVERDVRSAVPERSNVTVDADSQRKYAAWIGGSMFASLSTFGDLHIKREEYEESGGQHGDRPETIIHRRCL
jgi:actin beta/gamma 1|tara:strand:- start:2244 stop:3428 length:1185 start_codon:yes stop_codon:yes gene_type:complete